MYSVKEKKNLIWNFFPRHWLLPGYFNVWHWMLPNLNAARVGKRANPKLEAIRKYAQPPLALFAGLLEKVRADVFVEAVRAVGHARHGSGTAINVAKDASRHHEQNGRCTDHCSQESLPAG